MQGLLKPHQTTDITSSNTKKSEIQNVQSKIQKKSEIKKSEKIINEVKEVCKENQKKPVINKLQKSVNYKQSPLKPLFTQNLSQKEKLELQSSIKDKTKHLTPKSEKIRLQLKGNHNHLEEAKVNTEVVFERLPNEFDDPTAIAVYSSKTQQLLGHVLIEESKYFSILIDFHIMILEKGVITDKKNDTFIIEAKCLIYDLEIDEKYKVERNYNPGDYIEANKWCKPLVDKGIVVLSLFDGISGARVALDSAGIPVKKYYASEIDRDCIDVVKTRYPDTINLGDITKIDEETLNSLEVDLLIGGSPCQDFSTANKSGRGLEGEKSKLFFEYSRILQILRKKNPNLMFILENVFGMKSKDYEIISEHLGVYPAHLDAGDVSACVRRRYYWSNLPIRPLEKVDITLSDVIEEGETYRTKAPCIYCSKRPLLIRSKGKYRYLTSFEEEKCMGFPPNYTCIRGITERERHIMLGNSFSIPVVSHILGEMKSSKLKLVTKEDQEFYPYHYSTIWFDFSKYPPKESCNW